MNNIVCVPDLKKNGRYLEKNLICRFIDLVVPAQDFLHHNPGSSGTHRAVDKAGVH